MTSDLDIFRSAKLLIRQHGDEAPIFAAMKADRCFENNDFDGKATWLRVIEAIKELLNKEPPRSGTLLH